MSLNDMTPISRAFSFLSDKVSGAKVSDRSFLAALALALPQESASGSIESLRRSVMEFTGQQLSKQSFHERLGTQKLQRNLVQVLSGLRLTAEDSGFESALKLIGVEKIFLQDSTTLSLPKEARFVFKGVNTDKESSAIKIHATFDLTSSSIIDHQMSAGTENDTNFFVDPLLFENNLIIADLGFYNFDRFAEISAAGGYFLSRLKNNAKATVVGINNNKEKENLAKNLNETTWASDIVDCICSFGKTGSEIEFRVVGFWNNQEEKYHFYLTNLSIEAKIIGPLYKARW